MTGRSSGRENSNDLACMFVSLEGIGMSDDDAQTTRQMEPFDSRVYAVRAAWPHDDSVFDLHD